MFQVTVARKHVLEKALLAKTANAGVLGTQFKSAVVEVVVVVVVAVVAAAAVVVVSSGKMEWAFKVVGREGRKL